MSRYPTRWRRLWAVGAFGASAVANAPLGAAAEEKRAPTPEVQTIRLEPREPGLSAPLPGLFLTKEARPGPTTYVAWVRSLDPHWSIENARTRHVDPDMVGRLKGLDALRHFQISTTPFASAGSGP